MSGAHKTRVQLPKKFGEQVTVNWGDGPPVTYAVTDGHVTVENEHLERFLSLFDGAKEAKDVREHGGTHHERNDQ